MSLSNKDVPDNHNNGDDPTMEAAYEGVIEDLAREILRLTAPDEDEEEDPDVKPTATKKIPEKKPGAVAMKTSPKDLKPSTKKGAGKGYHEKKVVAS